MHRPRLRPALLTSTILLSAALLAAAPQPARQPTSPTDLNPSKSRSGNFIVPPGIYTSIILANPSGGTATVTLKLPGGEALFVVPANDTLILPFSQPWQLGQQGTATSTQSTIHLTGMTTSGPIRFAPDKK